MKTTIKNIFSHQILDSRGNPTIEACIELNDGTKASACVPSGASTGDKEALELRDNHQEWNGKSVYRAIENIEKFIKPALLGESPFNISHIDNLMIELDGTANKSKIGANAILAVSLASVHVAAAQKKQPLFEHIMQSIIDNKAQTATLPIPMMNILNGGSHADNSVDIQEFMIMPIGLDSFSAALQAGVEIFHHLKAILKSKNYSTTIGDEGGFAPSLQSNEEALELILKATIQANYTPGEDIVLALDVAASELYNKTNKTYNLASENKELSSLGLIDYYSNLCKKYPIVSIEDGLDQNDWSHWTHLNNTLGSKVQIVGDDLTVTNELLLKKAMQQNCINAILIKLNQIGTFTETLNSIYLAQEKNYGVIISHRSGETEDTTIADLAVACNAGQIKTGSLCRTDRTAKYNQLLRIEKYLGNNLKYANYKYLGCNEEKK